MQQRGCSRSFICASVSTHKTVKMIQKNQYQNLNYKGRGSVDIGRGSVDSGGKVCSRRSVVSGDTVLVVVALPLFSATRVSSFLRDIATAHSDLVVHCTHSHACSHLFLVATCALAPFAPLTNKKRAAEFKTPIQYYLAATRVINLLQCRTGRTRARAGARGSQIGGTIALGPHRPLGTGWTITRPHLRHRFAGGPTQRCNNHRARASAIARHVRRLALTLAPLTPRGKRTSTWRAIDSLGGKTVDRSWTAACQFM